MVGGMSVVGVVGGGVMYWMVIALVHVAEAANKDLRMSGELLLSVFEESICLGICLHWTHVGICTMMWQNKMFHDLRQYERALLTPNFDLRS